MTFLADMDAPAFRRKIYLNYKESTTTVTGWLAETVPSFAKARTVANLVDAARQISSRKLSVPTHVRNAFRNAIPRRKHLTEWSLRNLHGASEIESNERHKHFNDSLAEAYELLFPDENGGCDSEPPPATITPTYQSQVTRFDVLSELFDEELKVKDHEFPDEAEEEEAKEEESADEPMLPIEDDPLKADFTSLCILADQESLISYLKLVWRLAGQGNLSILRATWLTNAAFGLEDKWGGTLQQAIAEDTDHFGDPNQPCAVARAVAISNDWDTTMKKFNQSADTNFTKFSRGRNLRIIAEEFVKFRKSHQHQDQDSRRGIYEWFPNPPEIVPGVDTSSNMGEATMTLQEGEEEGQQDDEFRTHCKEVFKGIRNSFDFSLTPLQNKPAWRNTLALACPLSFHMLGLFADHNAQIKSNIIFGTQLLIETTRSFLWATGEKHRLNCQIQAFKFADEFKKSLEDAVKAAKELSEDVTAASRYANHALPMIAAFQSDTSLNFWSQAPWAAGCHLHAFYDRVYLSTVKGLCIDDASVSFVLHGYNAIRVADPTYRAYPLLENLCRVFDKEIFKEEKPNRDFYKAFVKNVKSRVIQLERRATEGKQKFEFPVQDFASSIFARYGSPFDSHQKGKLAEEWKFRVQSGSGLQKNRRKQEALRADFQNTPSWMFLKQMNTVVDPEFTSEFPVARVNFLKIYSLCATVVLEYYQRMKGSEAYASMSSSTKSPEDGVSKMAGYTFTALDNSMKGKQKTSLEDEHHIAALKNAISVVCDERDIESCLWKGI